MKLAWKILGSVEEFYNLSHKISENTISNIAYDEQIFHFPEMFKNLCFLCSNTAANNNSIFPQTHNSAMYPPMIKIQYLATVHSRAGRWLKRESSN